MNTFKNFDKLDSDMQGVVKQLLKFNAQPLETLNYNAARNNPTFKNAVDEMASHSALVRTMNVAMPALPEKVARVEHALIPTRSGEVNARVFYPKDGDDALPVIVYFHGGGWVIADLNTYESSCRALCNAANAVVIAVAYRQSPEVPFPGAVFDAYDATQYVIQNVEQFGGDSSKVAVVGESAGGNLAAVVCLMARDERGHMPAAQVLIYPVTDTSMSQPSYSENEDTQPLHASMMTWFWKHYLANKQDAQNQYVAPLRATDVSGLPPAIVITAEFDPLRDEGEQYAQKLEEAGNLVKLQRFTGVTHEFFGLAGAVGKAKQAVKLVADGLKSIFEGDFDKFNSSNSVMSEGDEDRDQFKATE